MEILYSWQQHPLETTTSSPREVARVVRRGKKSYVMVGGAGMEQVTYSRFGLTWPGYDSERDQRGLQEVVLALRMSR